MIKIKEISINYQNEPIGLEKFEQVGWIIDCESDKRDIIQEAYHVQVATNITFDDIIYDTDKVVSDESAHVTLPGLALQSGSRFYLRAKTYTNAGESDWATTTFVMGLIGEELWCADFITAESRSDKEEAKGTYVRKQVNLDKKIESAFAFTTALGLYEFYINGRKVSGDLFTPGWTSYNKHLLYQVYDVKDYLNSGDNVVGAMLGAGWYKGTIGFRRIKDVYGDYSAFLCQIEVCYSDGSKELIKSDDSWQSEYSPVVFSEIYDGETYDATKEILDWNKDSCDFDKWKGVTIVDFDKSVLKAQSGAKVKVINELPVKEIITTPQGDTVIDFGQNLTGHVRFNVTANASEVVELKCFETLDSAGNVYTDNLRTAKQTIKYTCNGIGTEEYAPHFSFQGFRYIKVVSYPGAIKAENFTACAVHSDMGETGTFECSNPEVNQLQHNINWGMKGNFLDVPTDCPQRDERLGWTGDAQIFCREASFLKNTYTFYRKWLCDVAVDSVDGGVPHVVPDIVTGRAGDDWLLSRGTYGAAAWADVITIMPWTLYLTYGDTQILKERYNDMKAWVDFMDSHSEGHIWNYKLQFGDWVALDAEEGSYFGATPNDLTCTAYFAYSTKIMVDTAKVLGKDGDVNKYEKLYNEIVKAYRDKFLENGHLNAQTQTAQIVSLYFGLIPEEDKKSVTDDLLKLLKKENGHLVTGFVGTPYFCHALSENGQADAAYELLLKDDFPSWLYQVKQGATTIWEHWDGLKPDGTMWSPDMNSFNHYAYGAVGDWLFRVVAGVEVDADKPGYKHIIIEPKIGGNMKYAAASFKSIYGMIKSRWEVTGDKAILSVNIPINTTATIKFGGKEHIVGSGNYTFES
ncbi:MAG: family 78 glycoside hydrolase catalytic domain [Suipraeoptans sp.]